MKLHLSGEPVSLATSRKLKSIIESTGSQVELITYKLGDDISKLSAVGTLPLLETAEGTFFASNTIARYLATANKIELYGNGNMHNQALIDQWLDLITCDFEPSVRAISNQVNGHKIDFSKLIADLNKFL
jgi:glutathione S-transferase